MKLQSKLTLSKQSSASEKRSQLPGATNLLTQFKNSEADSSMSNQEDEPLLGKSPSFSAVVDEGKNEISRSSLN
jgi:hypothetical protein